MVRTASNYNVTFYVKADDMTPATAANTERLTVAAKSQWMAQMAGRQTLCERFPSGLGGSQAVILDVKGVAR